MGLYLAVFVADDVDDEVDGVEVGSYDDFHTFREQVRTRLEDGVAGARFPVLMHHHDSAGVWTSAEAAELLDELATIRTELGDVVHTLRDVEGDLLVVRIADLARASIARDRPIEFQ